MPRFRTDYICVHMHGCDFVIIIIVEHGACAALSPVKSDSSRMQKVI